MEPLRLGLVGLGVMGRSHLKNLLPEETIKLVGIADVNKAAVDQVAQETGVPGFYSHHELLEKAKPEAVLIAVPHPFHAPIAIDAAKAGVHILCEKPIAVTVSEADAMIQAAKQAGVLLGVMFNQRTFPVHRKLKELIDGGEIGEIWEFEMISTGWYRLQSYYDSGSWRGTWKGEGGGVLANQAPHNLDMWQWLIGLPKRVQAVLTTRIHRIEVENTVHAVMEYEGAKVGYFRSTTADPLGKNRIEIQGDRGRLVLEGRGQLKICRYKKPVSEDILHTVDRKASPFETEWEEIEAPPSPGGHLEVTRQFARAIRFGEPLIATGEDGLAALELANAMHLSGLRRRPVDLPCDRAEVDRLFAELRGN